MENRILLIAYNINDTAVKSESWVDVENGGKGS
jgi:hypothetical protein